MSKKVRTVTRARSVEERERRRSAITCSSAAEAVLARPQRSYVITYSPRAPPDASLFAQNAGPGAAGTSTARHFTHVYHRRVLHGSGSSLGSGQPRSRKWIVVVQSVRRIYRLSAVRLPIHIQQPLQPRRDPLDSLPTLVHLSP